MAETTTTNAAFKKYDRGDSYNDGIDWADGLNDNWDQIDAMNGAGLNWDGSTPKKLAVQVDNSTIEISGDTVQIKQPLTLSSGIIPGSEPSKLMVTKTSLTNSQIKNLRATPVEIVPAPGAGKWIEIAKVHLILNYGSEVLTESSDNLRVEYGSSGIYTVGVTASGFITASADTLVIATEVALGNVAVASIVNTALNLKNIGDGEYGGNASNDTTMAVIVRYWIHDDTV